MDKVESQIEKTVILYTSLIVGICALTASVFNFLLNLGILISLLALFISISYFSLYGYIRKKGLHPWCKFHITFFSIFFINLLWYFNFFSKGSALINFTIILILILFIWNKKQSNFIVFGLIVNIAGLMIYELYNYQSLTNYPSQKSRIIDIYIGVFISLCIIYFYINVLKANYIKQYQQAIISDQLKTSFLSNLSHEIRTPLNSITGFSDLITSKENSHEQNILYNQYIKNNSKDLLTLIENTIDLSRIESNDLKIFQSEFEVNGFIETIHTEYARNFDKKRPVSLHYQKMIDPLIIKTDRRRMQQVIKNLLDNAIKYTNVGQINFGVKKEVNRIIFYVSDTGIGIQQKDMSSIFNQFIKVENKSKIYRGVGIGLHLSKRIASIMGGDVWGKSTFGKGSTFYFSLPIGTQKTDSQSPKKIKDKTLISI